MKKAALADRQVPISAITTVVEPCGIVGTSPSAARHQFGFATMVVKMKARAISAMHTTMIFSMAW